ncbi:MAG: GntR family transcriptional regulator [Deltaproteobacteria bacterium]|jgi:GntR family transcriptional regulator|nr:GntR family transcriptional regulator [Deltaproteobacteria bacterium]MBT4644725.1 GntR family transcriptional regulator [Deltaproteobacteria bacterium]MBT6504694.1 GntR family transcriptional regulator [Deltaproteobacteria bacterium]MBT6611582.1 GntR family transcriptional regulator [Deltaproteobacteria bacterium]MBT7153894.1 GntR family transcriptional regulator [Deltaproteobacteria bacterium]
MDLPIRVETDSGIPVYIQLAEQIKMLIHEGVLKVGDLMPTTRGLAVKLGLNANTVARVYRDLQTEGQLKLQRGVGTFVAQEARQPMAKEQFRILEEKVAEIIEISKQSNISPVELAQFIKTRWKEEDHA